MNKEEFLKELKEINNKKEDLINEYLCENTKFIIETKFINTFDKIEYIIQYFSYNEKKNDIIYYLDDTKNNRIILVSEKCLVNYLLYNDLQQMNNLK